MAGKFEVFKDKAGKFRFHLKAGNGEIVLESQRAGREVGGRDEIGHGERSEERRVGKECRL